MIIKSIHLKEGLNERKICFTDDVNLIFSTHNSKGKTTLLRMIMYSFGFNIPNTKKIRFEKCEVETLIQTDSKKELRLFRNSHNNVVLKQGTTVKTYVIPDQIYDLHSLIFETNNRDLLKNILGVFYVDQEKGWTLLNRGTVIGRIHFDIEEFIRGLANVDCSNLIEQLEIMSKRIAKYKQMASFAKFQESVAVSSNTLIVNDVKEQNDIRISQLSLRKRELQNELIQIDETIQNNKNLKKFINNMKLFIESPTGETFTITEKNIVGFEDSLDYLVAKRNMICSEIAIVSNKIIELEYNQTFENEQLSFFEPDNMVEIFDRKIVDVPINAISVQREIGKLESNISSLRKQIEQQTKSNMEIIESLFNSIKKYFKKLDLEDLETENSSYIFTSNLKELSGAILHKTVFAFKLAYIVEVEKQLGIILPIILDSPYGKEVDSENVKLMMNILNEEFTNHQIIIASIYNYEFTNINKIELKSQLIE